MKDKLDPRQLTFVKCYTDPDSPTCGKAYQSAIKAGYSHEYAKQLPGKSVKVRNSMVQAMKDKGFIKPSFQVYGFIGPGCLFTLENGF